jgi:hypothetical protein
VYKHIVQHIVLARDDVLSLGRFYNLSNDEESGSRARSYSTIMDSKWEDDHVLVRGGEMNSGSLYSLSIAEDCSERGRERRGGGPVHRYLLSKSNVCIVNKPALS